MKTLRLGLLLLLVAHGLLLAWSLGLLGGTPGSAQREPERLAQQHRPEALRWLAPQDAARALRQAPVCREVGPLADGAALQRARAQLLERGVPEPQPWEELSSGEWGVASSEADSDAELARKRQTLQRAGLQEGRSERLRGESGASWVLSRHAERADAVAALRQLRERSGLAGLRLVQTSQPRRLAYLRSSDWPPLQATLTSAEWQGTPRLCAAGLSPASLEAAAAASAASSARPAGSAAR